MKLIALTKIEGGTLEDALSRIEVEYDGEQDTIENLCDGVDIKEIFPSVKDWDADFYVNNDIVDDLIKYFKVDNEDAFTIWDASGNEIYEN